MNNEDVADNINAIDEKPDFDHEKLKRIIKNIIQLEQANVKAREYNDEELKKKIDKIIEEEVKCC